MDRLNIENMNSDMGLLLIIRNYYSSQYDLRRYISENQAKLEAAGYIIEFADMAGPLEEFGTFEDHNRSEDGEYRRLLDDMADAIGTTYRDLHLALRRLFYRDARYHNKILQLRPYDFYAFLRNNSRLLVRDIKAAIAAYNASPEGGKADQVPFAKKTAPAKEVLYVDCCLRGAESRTAVLAERFLEKLGSGFRVTRLVLEEENLVPLKRDPAEKRQQMEDAGDYSHLIFDYAKQFAKADKIVIAAPYWDLSFPALLRTYIERVCAGGITFQYTEKGNVGLCRADKLLFISTAGGPLINGNLGAVYLKDLCGMLGIDQFDAICADGLDIAGVDVDGILDSKNAEITEKAAAF